MTREQTRCVYALAYMAEAVFEKAGGYEANGWRADTEAAISYDFVEITYGDLRAARNAREQIETRSDLRKAAMVVLATASAIAVVAMVFA